MHGSSYFIIKTCSDKGALFGAKFYNTRSDKRPIVFPYYYIYFSYIPNFTIFTVIRDRYLVQNYLEVVVSLLTTQFLVKQATA